MPAEPVDGSVERTTRAGQLVRVEDRRKCHPQALTQVDQVVERDSLAPIRGGRPDRVLAGRRRVVGRHGERDPLGEEFGVAQALAQPHVVVAIPKRGVAIERDCQRARRKRWHGILDPPGGTKETCGQADGGKTKARVAHGSRVYRLRAPPRRYDSDVADDPPTNAPGERRLARPPSERYGTVEEPAAAPAGSLIRGLALGSAIELLGAAAITVSGGLLAITAGLLVVAGVVGWATAVAVVSGARTSIGASTRAAIAIGFALAGVTLGQVGLWLLARQEGGVLPFFDYLAEVFGPLVPLELAIAGLVAWWRSK